MRNNIFDMFKTTIIFRFYKKLKHKILKGFNKGYESSPRWPNKHRELIIYVTYRDEKQRLSRCNFICFLEWRVASSSYLPFWLPIAKILKTIFPIKRETLNVKRKRQQTEYVTSRCQGSQAVRPMKMDEGADEKSKCWNTNAKMTDSRQWFKNFDGKGHNIMNLK